MGNQWVVANLLYKKIVVAVFYYEIVLYVSLGDILYVFMSKKNLVWFQNVVLFIYIISQ